MKNMFNGTSSGHQDLSSFYTSRVTSMAGMFAHASAFNGDLSTFHISRVTSMAGMLNMASSFDGDLSSFHMSLATNMDSMLKSSSFYGDSSSLEGLCRESAKKYSDRRSNSYRQDIFPIFFLFFVILGPHFGLLRSRPVGRSTSRPANSKPTPQIPKP